MQAPKPNDANEFDELENQLRGLKPTPPSAGFEKRLSRELDALAKADQENRVVWGRFAPLATAACLVLVGTRMYREHLLFPLLATPDSAGTPVISSDTTSATGDESARDSAPVSFVSPPPISSAIPARRFVPVSSQQHLRQTTSGDVIEFGGRQPARKVTLKYDDAWHWHDPKTQTNVRVFRPREEIILVPVITD